MGMDYEMGCKLFYFVGYRGDNRYLLNCNLYISIRNNYVLKI